MSQNDGKPPLSGTRENEWETIQPMVMQGSVQLDYQWNPGSVIGAFLTSLREGELKAGRCKRTGKLFLPAQSRSPFGGRCDELMSVQDNPVLKAGTIVHRSPHNLPEGIQPPYMLAAIFYPGVETELIHLIVGSLETLKNTKPGDALLTVWAEHSSGSIRDILYFKPESKPLTEGTSD